MKSTIKIGRRGKDLAFRIPKALAEKFGLKNGDMIDSSIFERAILASRLDLDRERQ